MEMEKWQIRDRWLYGASWVVVGIGLIDSLYLAWLKFSGNVAACSGIGNCEAVNTSKYSEFAGMPIAIFGVIGYLVVLILLSVERWKPEHKDFILLLEFGVTLVGTIYSIYLTYVEIWILRAICPFCVLSAIAITSLLVITIIRLWNNTYSEAQGE
jgi:uncharacterized membrane protein